MQTIDFNEAFLALTGNAPFPWLRKLYDRFIEDRPDNIPSSCNIPTGLGKTSVIAVWLIALANHPEKLPQRLVYVVNRRTVVDQTTTEVERLRGKLQDAGLDQLLRQLCAIPIERDEPPLAISTLRGQFADNREWSADPARPAVIAGTVDMIGSRLLFGGYGVGFKAKPLHAGFLAQDVLLVHDEAHLEPAFQKLIEQIQREQREGERVGELPWRKLQVMALTATARNREANGESALELTTEEKNPPAAIPDPPIEPLHVAWRRLTARKHLCLRAVEDEKDVPGKIAKIAAGYKDANAAVLVFVRILDAVSTIEKELDKTGRKIVTLTGTMRGKERDELVRKPEFRRFFKGAEPGETVYLVCTSAGEVGIDISAAHMVCDLSTFDSMAQRLGRVHRYGDPIGHVARIDVVHPVSFGKIDKKTGELKADEIDRRRSQTLTLLRKLHETGTQSETREPIYDASPKALGDLRQRFDLPCKIEDAFAPPPTILPVTDILLDCWALTTIRVKLPGRPDVEPYLHGLSEREPPETYVAWREEVGRLTPDRFDTQYLEELLEDYLLKPHELLRGRTYGKGGVLEQLEIAAAREPDQNVWLVDWDGALRIYPLRKLVEKDSQKKPIVSVANRTVILPPLVGALARGLLNGNEPYSEGIPYDVADEWFADDARTIRRRIRVWDDDPGFDEKVKGMRLVRRIDMPAPDDDEDAEGRSWHWYELPKAGDSDGSAFSSVATTWCHHTKDVTTNAKRIANAFFKDRPDLHLALVLAAKFHDLGKNREIWQRGIGNDQYPQCSYAKSGRLPDGSRLRPRQLNDNYRHEFGSLLDVLDQDEFKGLKDGPQLQDLILHLIAAHHGRGRPHFPQDEDFDREPKGKDVAAIAAEIPRRFARLQRRYGRWGLAYLESLLRAADYAASAKPSHDNKEEDNR